MEIIGVPHLNEFLGCVEDHIDRRYDGSPRSMLLEIPPKYKDPHDIALEGFFGGLVAKYSERGTRIIRGDLAIDRVPKYIELIYRKNKKEERDPTLGESAYFLAYVLHGAIKYCLLDGFLNVRNKGLARAIEIAEPEVVVVGRVHADFLKKRFPEAHYTAFRCPEIEDRWLRGLFFKAPNADEVVDLPML